MKSDVTHSLITRFLDPLTMTLSSNQLTKKYSYSIFFVQVQEVQSVKVFTFFAFAESPFPFFRHDDNDLYRRSSHYLRPWKCGIQLFLD
jgi:hypothetical protein